MARHEFGEPRKDDAFSQIVENLSDIGESLQFHERGEYGEVDISSEMKFMRESFEEHVKAAIAASPDGQLSDEEYVYIMFMLNRTDMIALEEVAPGRTVCVGEGAFTAYDTETGTAFENIAEHERISGEFMRFLIAPMPSIAKIMDGDDDAGDKDMMNYELGVLLKTPSLEDEYGSRKLPYTEMFVSISDPSVSYTVRLDS